MSWKSFLHDVEKAAKEVAKDVEHTIDHAVEPPLGAEHHHWLGPIEAILNIERKVLEILRHLHDASRAVTPETPNDPDKGD